LIVVAPDADAVTPLLREDVDKLMEAKLPK
jgi:hypothetical protein